MMEILGVDRDENAHSKFLSWLFENAITGKKATSLLIGMLQDGTTILEEEIDDVKVLLEDFVEVGEYHGRADIVMDVKYKETEHLYIIIENKIDSFEHRMGKGQKSEDKDAPWQTEGYCNYYKEKYGENCVFVFLTRPIIDKEKSEKFFKEKNTNKIDGRPQCESFICIDYQNVLDCILVELLDDLHLKKEGAIKRNDYLLSELIIRIDDYIRCLGYSCAHDDIIAIDACIAKECVRCLKENEELQKISSDNKASKTFWQTHKAIIRPLFMILAYLSSTDSEILKSLKNDIADKKEDIERIDKLVNGKDHTRYSIFEGSQIISVKLPNRKNETTELSKNALVRTIVWLYVSKQENITINKLKKIFHPGLRLINKGLTAKPETISNKVVDKKKHNKDWVKLTQDFSVNGKHLENKNIYVIQTGWDGTVMMNHFIDYAVSEFKKIDCHIEIKEVFPSQEAIP